MENSASAVVNQQQQQQTTAAATTINKSKKKSKNKKNSCVKNLSNDDNSTAENLENSIDCPLLATNGENGKSHSIPTVNGISNCFENQLHITDTQGSCKLNGVAPPDSAKSKDTKMPIAIENGYHIPSEMSEIDIRANGDCPMAVTNKNNNKVKNKMSNKYRNKNIAAEHCLQNTSGSEEERTTNLENGLSYDQNEDTPEQTYAVDADDGDNDKVKHGYRHQRVTEEISNSAEHVATTSTEDDVGVSKDTNTDHISTAKQNNDTNLIAAATAAANVCMELTTLPTKPALDLSNAHIEYKEYESELQMHDIMRLIQAELSEPYSIYTYRYFIYNWPKLCFLATHGNEYVGAIVCKLDMHMNVMRGYIAMLAVRKEYRKLRIGTTLVEKAIEAMLADNADEVVLETEMRNLPALRLYENLGFVRDKRLFRYYLNGVDALRLKLWFR